MFRFSGFFALVASLFIVLGCSKDEKENHEVLTPSVTNEPSEIRAIEFDVSGDTDTDEYIKFCYYDEIVQGYVVIRIPKSQVNQFWQNKGRP